VHNTTKTTIYAQRTCNAKRIPVDSRLCRPRAARSSSNCIHQAQKRNCFLALRKKELQVGELPTAVTACRKAKCSKEQSPFEVWLARS